MTPKARFRPRHETLTTDVLTKQLRTVVLIKR